MLMGHDVIVVDSFLTGNKGNLAQWVSAAVKLSLSPSDMALLAVRSSQL